MKAWEFLDKLSNVKLSKLEEKKGLGPILVENLKDFIKSDRFDILKKGFKDLDNKEKGLDLVQIDTLSLKDGKLISFGITGSFDISRGEIRKIFEKNGFKFSSSLSKKTNFLLCGKKPGSTEKKAQDLDIKIFYSLIDAFQNFNIKYDNTNIISNNNDTLF